MKKKLWGVIAFVVVSALAALVGKTLGRLSAVSSVERDAIFQHAPTGFFNVKWLASRDQVRVLRPKTILDSENSVSEQKVFYGRNAKITYYFQDNPIVMFIVTFREPSSI